MDTAKFGKGDIAVSYFDLSAAFVLYTNASRNESRERESSTRTRSNWGSFPKVLTHVWESMQSSVDICKSVRKDKLIASNAQVKAFTWLWDCDEGHVKTSCEWVWEIWGNGKQSWMGAVDHKQNLRRWISSWYWTCKLRLRMTRTS